MLDPKLLKDDANRHALKKRDPAIDFALFDELDETVRALQTQTEQKQALRNRLASRKQEGEQAEQAATLRVEIQQNQEKLEQLKSQRQHWLLTLPNLPHPSVPCGESEKDNKIVFQTPVPPQDPNSKDHVDIGATFGLDQEASAALSGSRFAVMKGPLARLHRALIQLMLDTHIGCGYEEVYVPYLVKEEALVGTGQLPKFEEDLFKTKEHYLIPTAEVPLTNLVAQQTLDASNLPCKMVAHTPCFRQEAGSAGRDTRGLIRQHQFEKVELVQVTLPSQSEECHKQMLDSACSVLEALELPYRVVELCTGDLGFASQKTFDIEVWLPSQNTFREISSVSNCGDFQARRMKAKYKDKNEKGFLHTLNGSGVAVGRALVALLENHIQPDGSLKLPKALQPYMGGVQYIKPHSCEPTPNKTGKNVIR